MLPHLERIVTKDIQGPSQHHSSQQSSSSPISGQADKHLEPDEQALSGASVDTPKTVATWSKQPVPEHGRTRHEQPPAALKRFSRQPAHSGKGKAPERLSYELYAETAKALPTPKPSSSSQRIHSTGQIDASPASGPSLLLNEKTAQEAAKAIDTKIVKSGRRKVWVQKELITLFVICAK